MILYGSSLSPFVRKVLICAKELGIALENPQIPPQSADEDFRSASPFGKIPALRDGDFTISDSSAIVAYFNSLKPEAEIIPRAPKALARAVWFDEYADTILFDAIRTIFSNRVVATKILKIPTDMAAADKAENEALPPVLDYLETVVPSSGFLVEDRLTLADIAVVSPLINLGHAGITLNPKTHPKAAAYVAAILARPSVASVVEPEKTFLKRFEVTETA